MTIDVSITDTAERSSVVTRRCEPKSVFGVHCKYESQGYDSSIVCTCDSDNCNRDQSCTCDEDNCNSSTQAPSPTSTPSSTSVPNPTGLRCQVCGGNKGTTGRYFFACDSDNDNGKSIECNEGYNQCWYYQVSDHGDNYTIRECGASLPEKCWKGENMNGVSQSHSAAFYKIDYLQFYIIAWT